jgi:hypothetical protein
MPSSRTGTHCRRRQRRRRSSPRGTVCHRPAPTAARPPSSTASPGKARLTAAPRSHPTSLSRPAQHAPACGPRGRTSRQEPRPWWTPRHHGERENLHRCRLPPSWATVRGFQTARIGPRMQFLRGAAGGCSLCCPPAAPNGRIAAIRGALLSRYPPVRRHQVAAHPGRQIASRKS